MQAETLIYVLMMSFAHMHAPTPGGTCTRSCCGSTAPFAPSLPRRKKLCISFKVSFRHTSLLMLLLIVFANLVCRHAEKNKTSPQVEQLLQRVKDLLAEKESIERRHQGSTPVADLDKLLAERDQIHAGKLQKEKEEVLQLKGELEKLKKEHAKEI